MTKFSFYDSVGAYQILDVYKILEENKKNNLVSNLDKKEHIIKLDEEANPIILYYEFKDAE